MVFDEMKDTWTENDQRRLDWMNAHWDGCTVCTLDLVCADMDAHFKEPVVDGEKVCAHAAAAGEDRGAR